MLGLPKEDVPNMTCVTRHANYELLMRHFNLTVASMMLYIFMYKL